MAAEPTKDELKQREHKAKTQRTNLRNRIKSLATAVIKGQFDAPVVPFQPQKVHDDNHPEWQTLWKNQKALLERIAGANDAMDGGMSKERLIVSLRADFPEIAKKIPAPVKKTSPPQPAPTPPPAPAQESPAAASKRKQIEEDEDDDEEYDPGVDARAQREERAAKRQRSAGEATATATSTDLKPTMDEADLEMQVEEIQMKANLQILQLKRKFAADKKKREQMEAKIKLEGK